MRLLTKLASTPERQPWMLIPVLQPMKLPVLCRTLLQLPWIIKAILPPSIHIKEVMLYTLDFMDEYADEGLCEELRWVDWQGNGNWHFFTMVYWEQISNISIYGSKRMVTQISYILCTKLLHTLVIWINEICNFKKSAIWVKAFGKTINQEKMFSKKKYSKTKFLFQLYSCLKLHIL